MPNGNRRGPGGQGPRTGRAAGYCAGAGQPGWMNDASAPQGGGRGWRGGRQGGGPGGRGGHGYRHQFVATGLTGWQRAQANLQGSAPEPAFTPNSVPGAAPAAGSTPEQELAQLRRQAGEMEAALAQLKQQIDRVGGSPEGETPAAG